MQAAENDTTFVAEVKQQGDRAENSTANNSEVEEVAETSGEVVGDAEDDDVGGESKLLPRLCSRALEAICEFIAELIDVAADADSSDE